MSPEERVNLALELTSSITSITLESIKNKNPHISNRRLVEIARRRFQRGRRPAEDALLEFVKTWQLRVAEIFSRTR